MEHYAIWISISILTILSVLFLSDSNDFVSFSSSSFGEKQNRKIKGEHFFFNFLLTILTIACFALLLYQQKKG
ncbi:hypothetical protein [Candidatus Phytoplasma solani]|uniref:Uncharacterized protein n=1 Tax=Candidatus Phytoplasma solani TaxID=69896 RepID=A0A421NXP2_9MOLU|nr:hypothetical protein [Candidatus Phytoplasma solani]RMI88765.1 hypothetical protein PSSA1_v1c3630 [Candidatus Phytoplasma solani]CCP88574.1 hypothetical protein S231_01170 [Candidatus Phytoplasma solani]